MDILKQAWYLRTHPFSPTCDPFGENLAFDTSRSLDPLGLDQLLHLYFDVYKWDQSSEIRQLSQKDGLGRFPNLDSLVENNDTQVVIVSGRDLSGVRSMVNLIKFKAEQNSSKTPLMFSGRLNLQSKDGWAKTIIKFFNDRYRSVEPQPPYQVLK